MDTESLEGRLTGIDTADPLDALGALLDNQFAAVQAVAAALPAVRDAAVAAAERLRGDGRLMFAGAGTSARLAVQDGTELAPTYSWPRERLVYVIAGGPAALTLSIEGAEDDREAGFADLAAAQPTADDVLIAVSASGRTPFTLGALDAARQAGALTIGIASNAGSPLVEDADHGIVIETGPEPIAGSTRMGAGTGHKVALNLLSTLIMVRLGRVYDGLMVDVELTNEKLRHRAARMVKEIVGCDAATAEAALSAAGGHVKLAALLAHGLSPEAGRTLLDERGGNLREALSALAR